MASLEFLRAHAQELSRTQGVPIAERPILAVDDEVRAAYPNLSFDLSSYIGSMVGPEMQEEDLKSLAVSITPRKHGQPQGYVSHGAQVVPVTGSDRSPVEVCYPFVSLTVLTKPWLPRSLLTFGANIIANHEARHITNFSEALPVYDDPRKRRTTRIIGSASLALGTSLIINGFAPGEVSAEYLTGVLCATLGGLGAVTPYKFLHLTSVDELDANSYGFRATMRGLRPLQLG